MARKEDLRVQRAGTVINLTSRQQETALGTALETVVEEVVSRFKVRLEHSTQLKIADVVSDLRDAFPEIEFDYHFESSAMRPDGGILYVADRKDNRFPILITEVKNQGTNDLRLAEGKKKQAKGNAIERLGKNVIGFRTAMMSETIVPFLCFGYGCDFADDSSILDRVSTIAMFGPLNQISVVNQGDGGAFNRGSFFFREEAWSVEEMSAIMLDVATRSLHYYFAKYGEEQFLPDA